VHRQHHQLLVVLPIGGDLAAVAKEDEIIGTISVLHDIEPLVNLAT
jgi:hypothetical protein